MGERRLKRFLLFLVVISIALAARAMQIQIIDGGYWAGRSQGLMQKVIHSDTIRGKILDVKGREIAVDEPCIDACVDFRAITREPEARWLNDQAVGRLRSRLADGFRKLPRLQQRKLIAQEAQSIREDIEAMWITLAGVYRRQSGPQTSIEEAIAAVDDIRRSIEQKIEMRRRYIWYTNYAEALRQHAKIDTLPWYRQILGGSGSNAPRLDSFAVEVAEQTQPHVVLRAIDSETYNELGRNLGKYPGLVLQLSKHRVYPFDEAGCHFIGNMARVTREDLEADANAGKDELREYWPNDLIGRSGLESLYESTLRGARGRVVKGTSDQDLDTKPAETGRDIRCTIDIELQRKIQTMFANAPVSKPTGNGFETELVYRPMHGAVVVIDVPTGEVRVLASYPSFDLNRLEEEYAQMSRDDYNMPLFNRATQAALEPGSTVKPLVGLSAITAGVMRPDERIECKGYLEIDGKRQTFAPRCWVLSMFGEMLKARGISAAHHPIPDFPKSTGFLDLSEGLERSCNIYFETCADRLGLEALGYWYKQFGLGRKTGIGIVESAGRSPDQYRGPVRKIMTWYGGIGQGWVAATPLQMANVAATVAREGTWMRPALVHQDERAPEDAVDLHLSAVALQLAHDGMRRVVSSPAGGAYKHLKDFPVDLACKTGSAQAAKFRVPVRDEDGKVTRQWETVRPSTFDNINPLAPWYLAYGKEGKELTHSWFIGYAPAGKPQIAFAVMMEYAGAGGSAAVPMARQVLEACIDQGYLSKQ